MPRLGDPVLHPVELDEAEVEGIPSGSAHAVASAVGLLSPTGRRARGGRGRLLLARRGERWDAERVAAHLMSCRGRMVFGLRHKSPWAGVDLETLESCFGAGAALVAELASTGQRPDWRTAEDLEKAQIAAYRNQVRDHWKHVNAQKRAGDRLAVVFDPERHAVPDAQLERLFAQPDLFEARRDLLSEMDDPELRAFWSVLLEQRLTFKAAGDQLGLTKAEVMTRLRAGRVLLRAYRERRDSGDLCVERGLDIAATRVGAADDAARERAEAHLETCYACSLVHAPRTSAFGRGVLGLTPVGLLLRLGTRLGEATTGSAARWADAGAGARVAVGGLAAVALAGSAAGVEAVSQPGRSPASPVTSVPVAPARPPVPPAVREVFRTPGVLGAPPATRAASDRRTTRSPRAAPESRASRTPARTTASTSTTAPPPAPTAPPPAEPEFSFERSGHATPAPTTSASPAATEFAAP